MTIDELIAFLTDARKRTSDDRVYWGTLYQDFPLAGAVIEDGYVILMVEEDMVGEVYP